MTIEIKVPVLPESVADASIATWHVKAGDAVKRDQNLVDIETDKVVLEVVAPADGTMGEILNEEGATVLGEQVIAKLEEGGAAAPAKSNTDSAKKRRNQRSCTSGFRKSVRRKSTGSARISSRCYDCDMARCCW